MSAQQGGTLALKALRRKFIFTNMLFVVIVLAIMCAVMTATTMHQRTNEVYDALERRLSMSLDAAGGGARPTFEEWRKGVTGDASGEAATGETPRGREMHGPMHEGGGSFIATAVYLIDPEGSIVASVQDPLGLEDSVLETAMSEIAKVLPSDGNMVRGKVGAAGLFYMVKEYSYGAYEVALVPSDYVDSSVMSLLKMLAAVCIVALLAFFAMSVFLSRWALGPVRRAWDQQQQFIADASHELKTPLTVILANNSLVMADPTASVGSQMQWLESTESEARLMQGLVNDMLYLARSDATVEQSMGDEPVDMSDLVASVSLQFESVAFERGVMIEDDIDDGIVVRGDHANLQRLLGTLVDNAVKYVEENGTVKVSLKGEGSMCRIDVHNTGNVIPADDLPHLFDRFYSADKARTRGTGGFGLGLAIAQSIVEAHGGTIGVTSTEADGTTFTVHLPSE